MNCEEARSNSCAQLDRELSDEVAREFFAHLSDCAACREEFSALGRVREMLGPILGVIPAGFNAPGLWAEVEAGLGLVESTGGGRAPSVRRAMGRRKRSAWRTGSWRILAGAAVAAGLIAGLWTLLSPPEARVRVAARPVPAREQSLDPQFFVDFPVVRQLDRFQVLDAVLAESEASGRRVACGDSCP